MMFLPQKKLWSGLLLSLLCALIAPVSAQDALMNAGMGSSQSEALTVTVGDILEVLPSSDLPAPTYSWILTQDRTFMQAGRSTSFRYRFIQPGNYSLIAEIHAADQTTTINRVFTITAKAREPGNPIVSTPFVPTGSGTQTTDLVRVDPAIDSNQRVVLGNNQQLIKLMPVSPETRPLSLDINMAQDSNNDGNPANDVDNVGSFFQLYADPLYVWFASPIQSTSILVTTIGTDGSPRTQQIAVESLAYAQSQGTIVSPITIAMQSTGNGAYTFSPESTNGSATQTSLLYHWTFGDGEESLIMNPSHTFASDGLYTITLQVRNLIDGKEVANIQQQVQVVGITSIPSSASSAASSTSTGTGGTSSFSLMPIVIGGGIFLLFAIVGIGVVFLISRLRGGKSLDQTFAAMEKTIVSKDDAAKNPPTLTIPATSVTAKVTPAPTQEDLSKREENAASTARPAETPRIDEKAAPDWLKKGLDSSAKAPTPPAPPSTGKQTPSVTTIAPDAPIPTPPWLQSNHPTAPIDTKTAAPTPPAPAPMPKTPAPPWLQQTAATPSAAVSSPPTPPPSFQEKPATAQPQTPVVPEAPAVPTPSPAPVPSPAPKPITSPVAPTAPAAPSVPTPAPKPVTPPVPTPAAERPTPVPSTPAPVASPKPQAPATPPTPVAVPSPINPPAPKPVASPAPAPQQQPSTPTPKPTPLATPIAPPKPVTPPTPSVPKPITPPVAPTAPAAPSVPNPAPKPVTPPVPTPAAERSTPAPAPVAVPQPKVVSSNPPKPLPTPQTPLPTPPVPVAAPTPRPTPVPPAAPKPQSQPTPAPFAPPAPKPQPAPAPQPQPTPAPKRSMPEIREMEQTDLPIAIIRADSLDQKKADDMPADPS